MFCIIFYSDSMVSLRFTKSVMVRQKPLYYFGHSELKCLVKKDVKKFITLLSYLKWVCNYNFF